MRSVRRLAYLKRRGMLRRTELGATGRSATRRARANIGSNAKPKSRERMGLAPQSICHPEWINADLCPPCCFVTTSMYFAVMSTAQWDRELITAP